LTPRAAACDAKARAVAGYSGTPLPQKLGIKPGVRLSVVAPPADFEHTLALPPGVERVGGRSAFDVAIVFCTSLADLRKRLTAAMRRLDPSGGLWIAWPKRASGIATDVTEDRVRELGLAAGLVDNKVCAIDDTWSGLRLVVRIVDRPKAPKRPAKTRRR
jgi:hypothetical protein